MKTQTIFKTLALATMMPAMLLTTACSSDDDAVNNEINNNGKGYALPVTINVTRGDGSTTRATYNEGTKTLSFSSGDQLFVKGTDGTVGAFAGTLEWVSDDTFSGTIYTANPYSDTADALLTSASTATATLLPAGYGSIGYLSVSGEGCNATLATDATKAFATSKADGVAQLSLEQATTYDDGFALAPQNAILNFTSVTGQWGSAPASSTVSLQAGETTISGSVAPVEGDYSRALANFAIAVAGSASPSSLTLTVDGTSVSLGSHTLTAGKIYNQKCANINAISPMIGENEKWLVYGTGAPSGWRLTIAEGATVTLSNVNLNDYAIIAYRGNNTIILADGTTNTIDPGSGVAIDGTDTDDKTLTIKGTGTLIATGGYGAPAIGVENPDHPCGDITIESSVTLEATAGAGQSKAITTGTGGGTVTIGGVVYDGGANSPFVYPVPAPSYKLASEATTSDYGMVVCNNGHLHPAKTEVTGDCTAVAVFGYISGSDRYAIALQDASNANWNTITSNGANAGANCAVPGTWNVAKPDGANWYVATQPIYSGIFQALGSSDSYNAASNAFITTNVGGTELSGSYWTTTEYSGMHGKTFEDGRLWQLGKTNSNKVRPVLKF